MDEERLEELLAGRTLRNASDLEQLVLDCMEYIFHTRDYCDSDTVAQELALLDLGRPPNEWQDWVDLSHECPLAWRVCVALVETLRVEAPLLLFFSPLRDWALDVAQGIRVEPRRPGRDPFANWIRNLVIVHFVAALRDLGSRPATSNIPGKSACHLVADRLGLSYQAVRNVWLDCRKYSRST